MALAAIALGSNLGDPRANVEKAIAHLDALGNVTKRSALHETKPWGVREQPDFINAVVLLETQLGPRALLTALQRIEREMGRVKTYKWGPRTIDLDIILYDDVVVDEPDLKIPHPHFRERAFVLGPLSEIDERYRNLRS